MFWLGHNVYRLLGEDLTVSEVWLRWFQIDD